MSRIDPNDPRLTAYALDEMPAADRAAFEIQLRADPAAQAVVAEIRGAAAQLADALAQEPAPQRAIEPPRPARRSAWGRLSWTLWIPLGATAALALFISLNGPPAQAPATGTAVAAQPAPVQSAVATAPVQPTVPPSASSADATASPAVTLPAVEPTVSPPPLPPPVIAEIPRPATALVASRLPTLVEVDSIGAVPGPDIKATGPRLPAPSEVFSNGRNNLVRAQISNESATARSAASTAANATRPGLTPRTAPRVQILDIDLPPVGDGWRLGQAPAGTAAVADPSLRGFLCVARHPCSTVVPDGDSSSFAALRRFLTAGQRPPVGLVRLEALLGHFGHSDPVAAGTGPLGVTTELRLAPWAVEHRLLRIGLQGRPAAAAPARNLVFLLDVSGSMVPAGKLPLLCSALGGFAATLRPQDRVAIVTYSHTAELALPPTPGDRPAEILAALNQLQAGGAANGAPALSLAYEVARRQFLDGGINRVLLCTDGDFNLGLADLDARLAFVAEQARAGIGLSTLGLGTDGYSHSSLEKFAVHGGGAHGYSDTLSDAQALLRTLADGPPPVVAHGLQVQVEFNPARVAAYRLLGYEQAESTSEQPLAAGGGALAAGQTIALLYELVPVGAPFDSPAAAAPPASAAQCNGGDWLTVKAHYSETPAAPRQALAVAVTAAAPEAAASRDFQFTAAVAAFGLLLQDSPHKGAASWALVETLVRAGLLPGETGTRAEFLDLLPKARALAPERSD